MAEWGTVPDWVEAVASTGAFAAAGWLLWKELNEFRLIEQERRSENARNVGAWWTFEKDVVTDWDEETKSVIETLPGYMLHVKNASNVPVYNCDVSLVTNEPLMRGPITYPAIPPGETHTLPLDVDNLAIPLSGYPTVPDPDAWIAITFTAEGRRWQNSKSGGVTPLDNA